jgi:branched-chain amino acid transport system ATP-binding protein
MSILNIHGVSKRFEGLLAIDDISLTVEEGQIYALIGPNGAGKTTLFNIITGVYIPTSGKIVFDGNTINGLKPHKITNMGIARTFQNIRLFKKLSALDNIIVGMHCKTKADVFSIAFQPRKTDVEARMVVDRAEELLDYIGISDARNEQAENLSYGHQRLLEIARALATQPKLLLLDEPAAGMNIAEKQQLNKLIKKIRDEFKVTIMLVEHDMTVVMNISDVVSVLNYGKHLAYGSTKYIQQHPAVIEAYLGKGDDNNE